MIVRIISVCKCYNCVTIFSVLINRVRKLAWGVANNLIPCPLCEGFFYMEKDLGSIYCPLYGVKRCPLWRGSECTEVYVNGETIGTQKFVRYIAGVRR